MKKYIILFVIVLFSFCITFFGVKLLKEHNVIKKIKSSYNEFVLTNKDSDLLNDQKEVIGTVKENVYLELDSLNVNSKEDIYFKIKNSDYYIEYTNVSKTEKQDINIKDYYVDLGDTLSVDKVNLYDNNDLKISIDGEASFTSVLSDDSYYYVNYLNHLYQIKKDEVLLTKNDVAGAATFISVLNYNKIGDCSDCVSVDVLKEQLSYLRDNGYYTIDINDYTKWINNNINLKEKAVFITSKEDDSIFKDYGFYVEKNFDSLNFSESNSRSEKNNNPIPRYNIIGKTTLDMFKDILNGEAVSYITLDIKENHTLPDINSNASKIAVLNYHFFYDPELGESCPDNNCKKVQDFEKELFYLKSNNYKTLTMDEFTKWMDGEIELPARSVLITIDDGAMGTGTHNGNKLNPLLEKYNMHATLFLITGWWDINNYKSDYLDIESHTHNMHSGGACKDEPRGSQLLCSTKDQIKEDLSISISITGSKNAFCFPMYVYNDKVRQVLNELDVKYAFVGGDVKATRGIDKYKVPRYHIYENTSIDAFINMIS